MAKAKIIPMKNDRETPLIAEVKKAGGEPSAIIVRNNELLKSNPHNEKAYQQLMIHYRRLKDYKKELQTIDAAILAFEALYSTTPGRDKKVDRLSRQLNIAFGLTDKKGKMLHSQKPISTWKDRRKTVLRKLGLNDKTSSA